MCTLRSRGGTDDHHNHFQEGTNECIAAVTSGSEIKNTFREGH